MLAVCFLVVVGRSGAQKVSSQQAFRDCPDCPEMVAIPAGRFLMGSTKQDIERELETIPTTSNPLAIVMGYSDRTRAAKFMAYEQPQHPVTIPHGFALGRYPVTRGEFAAFVRETGYTTAPCWLWHPGRPVPPRPSAWSQPDFEQTDRDPVVCVNQKDANAYIRWLNGKPGHGRSTAGNGAYRLPTEAEWEYAARAGTRTARWWGNDIGSGNALCRGCGDPSERDRLPNLVNGVLVYPPCCAPPKLQTVPVGSFPPNPFGLYDMIGNVSEMTEDCWHESYTDAPTDGSAWMQGGCESRTTRGNSYRGLPWVARSTTRAGFPSSDANNDTGFRVAKTLP